jgi:molybdopterin/thiamine biosynthesis adenylyltransferase/nitroreductase
MPVHRYAEDEKPESGSGFGYSAAFSRNIGWVTEAEQQELRTKTVAIAGMGGVGGAHALTLARLGIGGFHLADFDTFDVVNLNRQAGAFMSTIGMRKIAVMTRMIADINPELRLKTEPFAHGLDEKNLDEFLAGVDLFVDGLDFFVIDIRRKVFKRCAELGIPAITAAPIGFGTCYLIFMPNGMSFEEYFRFEGLSEHQQYLNFLLGLTPKAFHRNYLVDPSRLNLAAKTGPSTAAAIQLCSGIVGAEAVKILLKRGKVHAAPAFHHFDGFVGKWHRGYLRFGNAGPLQSLKRRIGYKALSGMERKSRPAEVGPSSEIEHILDLARWAPSGDNTQPWGFEIHGEDRVTVNVTRKNIADDIYDYNEGQPTLVATGMLLETMRIAASRLGRALEWNYAGGEGLTRHISINLPRRNDVAPDPLFPYLTIRSVDRRAYRKTPLSLEHKAALEEAVGEEFDIQWRETFSARLSAAKINALATDIRLRLPEAYVVHRRIIDWERNFSPDGVPAQTIGLDTMTLRLMRWAMTSWNRADLMNRIAGTAAPQLQLDILPGINCAAHFTIQRREPVAPADEIASLLRVGQAVQRFWLRATAMGLSMQPAIAPIIFGFYAERGKAPDFNPGIKRKLMKLTSALRRTEDFDTNMTMYRGRIGWAPRRVVTSRSVRRPLASLIVNTTGSSS